MRPRLRKIAMVLGALLLSLLVAVAAALFYLRSEAGSALLREKVLAAINGAIPGKLELGRVSLSGETVVLTDLKLYTPEGELVAEAKRVEATGNIAALLRGAISLSDAKVDGLHVFLARDARGLNLVRAVEGRGTPSQGGEETELKIEVEAVALTDGLVEYKEEDRVVRLEGLAGKGGAKIRTGPLSLDANLALAGAFKAPVEGPLVVRATASGEAKALKASLFAEGGGLKADAAFSGDTLQLEVKTLEVQESLGRTLVGAGWPRATVHVEGKASLKEADLRASLDGQSKATVKGKYDLEKFRVEQAVITVSDFDLAQLREGLVSTRIDATVTGALDDFRPQTLAGNAKVTGAWKSVGDVTASLSARSGEAKVEQLRAEVPGAHVEVKGTASEAQLALKGRLEAKDAGLALRTVLAALKIEPIDLAASGTLDVAVTGPVLDPAIEVQGTLPQVSLGGVRATALGLAGALPSVRRWREVDAQLSARTLTVGEGSFESVSLGLATKGRDVSLDLSSKGLSALLVRAAGRFEGREALSLATLNLEWPGTTWVMESPSRLSWAQGVDLDPVKLRAGNQGLDLELHSKAKKLNARAALANFDVARLPSALVPVRLGLAGLVSGTVLAEGPQRDLAVTATLEWKDGKVRSFQGIGARADAHLEGHRIKGTLTATAMKARAEGNFDLPLLLGKAPPESPVSLALQLEEMPLEEILVTAGVNPVVTGPLRAGATLQGTVGAPMLALDASTLGAVVTRGEGRDVQVHSAAVWLETKPDGTPQVRVDITTLGGTLRADVSTPVKLAELFFHPPDAAGLRALGWTGDVNLTGLSLVSARTLLPEAAARFSGTLELTAHAEGPWSSPRLDARATVADFSSDELKPIQLAVELKGSPQSLDVTAGASLKAKQLLSLTAKSSLGLSDVLAGAVEPGETIALDGIVFPLDLTQLASLRGDDGTPMTGLFQARFDAGGTLGDPHAAFKGTLESLKLRKVALGKATVGVDYASGKSRVVVNAMSTNGGQMQLHGDVGLELSLPALKKGLDPLAAPVTAQLTSRGFDLSFLSGAHAVLRTMGGQVTADATADGKLGSPSIEGLLEWKQGRLGLAGLTEFRDIELKVGGNNELVTVDRLDAHSGAGTLKLRAEGRRQNKSAWGFTGSLDTEHLPVVADDQLRFILDLQSKFEGDLSAQLWNVRRLEIPVAHIQLPDIRKKDTQALDRPKDIVLVRDGVAVGPSPKRWKKKVADAAAAAQQRQKERLIRVVVEAESNLWLKGNDVNLEVGLSKDFRLEYDHQLYLNGDVTVLRGKVEVIGRKFDVQKDSSVRFTGPPSNPILNVTAAYANEREKVTVFATLTGATDDFTFQTSSQPALSDSEIYALLATGRRTLRSSGSSALTGEQGLSVIGSLVAAQFKTALSSKMPVQIFDVLEISAGDQGFKGTKLEAGKYLTDRIYVGYVGQVGADGRKGENGNAGRIEYQFAPGWSVQGTVGDAPAGSAELVWGWEF